MLAKLHYMTRLLNEPASEKEHTIWTTFEEATKIADDLTEGDFGDLICYHIEITTQADCWDGDNSASE